MSDFPSVTTRAQLRTFLHLSQRALVDRVPQRDVERQEDTVLRAMSLLERQPGVVLADEVGMGKTFEALGVTAAFHQASRDNRIVVLTPGPDLNRKWAKEISKFADRADDRCSFRIYDFGDDVEAVTSLGQFVRALRTGKRVVVAPVNIFHATKARDSQAYLLSLFFHWKGLHGQTANAILRRFRDGEIGRQDPTVDLFLGVVPYADLEHHLKAVFAQKSTAEEQPGLEELFQLGFDAFQDDSAVRRAIDQARFRMVRELMPELALLIVDEAHKLKNADTVRAQAVSTVFKRKFLKAVFLTATPFQLDIGELRQVFALFRNAKVVPDTLQAEEDQLFAEIREYQVAYEDFQRGWSGLDSTLVAGIERHFGDGAAPKEPTEDPSLLDIVRRYDRLLSLKKHKIEPGLRRFMIRSLREDKRIYRKRERWALPPSNGEALPFLVYERLIAELFRVRSPTHKAAVEINMVSSFGAARTGALLSHERANEQPSVEQYRVLLRQVLDQLQSAAAQHPKLGRVVQETLAAAERGEKTLVFCSRIETLEELARELRTEWEAQLLQRWQRLYPGASEEEIFDLRTPDEKVRKGRHALLQQRFHRGQDPLYLAFRERYVLALLQLHDWPLLHLDAVVAEANRILQEVRTGATAASRLDYGIAKRCVEQAVAVLWQRLEPEAARDYGDTLQRMIDPRFVAYGYDLEPDVLEGDEVGVHRPTWHITASVAQLIVEPRLHLWGAMASRVTDIPERARIDVVERIARYLTFRQVPLLLEVLEAASAEGLSIDPIESLEMLHFVDRFWTTPDGRKWVDRLATYLDHFTAAPGDVRDELLETIQRADFVRHTKDGDSRERLREAFNTPLFPAVLVANEVMQEGLDLHRSCRRVIHHDLAWNPAQLEQRVGRIDRLGSLTAKLREKDAGTTLDIFYPLIKNTIDERLYRTVNAREKWLEFILGASPDFAEYGLGDENLVPLPDRMAASLRVDLGPEHAPS